MFASTIEIERPRENYDITLNMVKLEINKALTDDQFALEQPAGRKWCGSTGRMPTRQRRTAKASSCARPAVCEKRHDESDDRRESGASALRSLISVVAIALEVTMILLIVGLSLGMLQDSRTRTAGIGLTCWCGRRGLRLSVRSRARRCRSRLEACWQNCPM